jgi:hypothetical protein
LGSRAISLGGYRLTFADGNTNQRPQDEALLAHEGAFTWNPKADLVVIGLLLVAVVSLGSISAWVRSLQHRF